MARYYMVYVKASASADKRKDVALDPDFDKAAHAYNNCIRRWKHSKNMYIVLEEKVTNDDTGEIIKETVIEENYINDAYILS